MGGDDLDELDVEVEEEEEEVEDLFEEEEEEEEEEGTDPQGGKRKREDDEEKKQKKKAKLKALKALKKQQRDQSDQQAVSSAFGAPKEQAHYIWGRCCSILGLKRDPPQLEAADMVEAKKPEGKVQEGEAFIKFIKQAVPDLQKLNDKGERIAGQPYVVIVSSSAVRANELAKIMRTRWRNLKTAKLFAKHLKLQEQIKVLQEFHAVAVGTPNRIKKLADVGALSAASLRLLVLDMQEDKKSFHLLTLPGVMEDTASYLQTHVFPEVKSSSAVKPKIGMFGV